MFHSNKLPGSASALPFLCASMFAGGGQLFPMKKNLITDLFFSAVSSQQNSTGN